MEKRGVLDCAAEALREREMAEKEIELTPKVYTFAAIGAVIFGVAGAWAFSGTPAGIVSPALIGALAGGALGLFF